MGGILSILIAILILIFLISKRDKHLFWDKQPVMRTYGDKIGIIGSNTSFNIKIVNPDMSLKLINTNVDEVYSLLNNNFSEYFNINSEFFNYIYNITGSINISLYDKDKVIGFIHSHPIVIDYNNSKIPFMYVDYLCIDKMYRSKDAAAIMIASLINKVGDKSMPFLFKRDSVRLPYLNMFKSRYYYDDIRKVGEKPIDTIRLLDKSDNLDKYLEYINKLFNRFKFKKLYSREDFIDIFIDKHIYKCYIISNNNGFETIVIGKANNFKWFGETYKTFDIDYILGELKNSGEIGDILKYRLKLDGYNFITAPHIANNIIFINENKLKKANTYYYYTYNYNLPMIEQHDCCFNIN